MRGVIQIRTRLLLLIFGGTHFLGCAEPNPPAPTPIASGSSTAAGAQSDAARIVDQAIAALGGTDARTLFSHGRIKLKIAGANPDFFQPLGTDWAIVELYFDSPDFERREIYAEPGGDHLLYITNFDMVWFRDREGNDQLVTRPKLPAGVGGVLYIGMFQSIVAIRESGWKLTLVDGDFSPGLNVVDASNDDLQLTTRISFDKVSSLPVQLDRVSFGLRAENFGVHEQTVTKLSGYQQFGRATLPTDVVTFQGEEQIVRISLESADFDTPVPDESFDIPD
jgi:hypothetical protein